MAIFAIAALLSYVVFWVRPAQAKKNNTSCQCHLRCLNVALWNYVESHNNGVFPEKIEDIYPTTVSDRNLLRCRISNDRISYAYLRMKSFDNKFNSTCIMLFSKEPIHMDGRNVSYSDCHIEWLSENAFQAELKRMLDNPKYRKQYTDEAIKTMEKYLKREP